MCLKAQAQLHSTHACRHDLQLIYHRKCHKLGKYFTVYNILVRDNCQVCFLRAYLSFFSLLNCDSKSSRAFLWPLCSYWHAWKTMYTSDTSTWPLEQYMATIYVYDCRLGAFRENCHLWVSVKNEKGNFTWVMSLFTIVQNRPKNELYTEMSNLGSIVLIFWCAKHVHICSSHSNAQSESEAF